VEWQPELERYSQDFGHVVAQVRRGDGAETIEADRLVSCEGAHSIIRRLETPRRIRRGFWAACISTEPIRRSSLNGVPAAVDEEASRVERRIGVGYTLNLGNPWSWMVIVVFVTSIAVPLLLVP